MGARLQIAANPIRIVWGTKLWVIGSLRNSIILNDSSKLDKNLSVGLPDEILEERRKNIYF